MQDLEVEYLLCGGIVSFKCPECGENIKATTDEVLSKETPFECPNCTKVLEFDEDTFYI